MSIPEQEQAETLEDIINSVADELEDDTEDEGDKQDVVEHSEDDEQVNDTSEEPEQEVEETEEEPEEEVSDAVEPLKAPEDWPSEDKEVFAKLPVEAQSILLEKSKNLQAGFTRKTQDLSEKVKFADSINQVFEPHKEKLAIAGLTPSQAIERLVALENMFSRNPKDYLLHVARSANIDLSELVAPKQEHDIFTDPAQSHLDERLRRLEQEEQRKAYAEQQRLEQERRASYNEAANIADTFAKEIGEDGNLKHPHFEAVRNHMGMLLETGQAKDIQDAYDRAVYANPEIRQNILKEQIEAAKREAIEAERKAASTHKAKKAGRVLSGSSDKASTKQVVPKTLKEALELAEAELSAV